MSEAAGDPVLSLRGVQRTYDTGGGRRLEVLRGADLDVRPGEIVGLIGPSGSGKSSLLHAAGLLEHPSGGSVLVCGTDCTRLNDAARSRLRLSRIGFVYQFHHLLPEFTALENVALPQMIAGQPRAVAQALWSGSRAGAPGLARAARHHLPPPGRYQRPCHGHGGHLRLRHPDHVQYA